MMHPRVSALKDEELSRNPRKAGRDMQKEVKVFLSSFDQKLETYITGPPQDDFWKAPKSSDPEISRFVNELSIPILWHQISLLLHDLGNNVVNESAINRLFDGNSHFLVNAPASGKTRLLLEGLCRHWGFFFTTSLYGFFRVGSTDIASAIDQSIHDSVFNPSLKSRDALNRNRRTAERRMHQVIRARVLVFERFLQKVRSTFPNKPIAAFKKHWLFLQLDPFTIMENDIFTTLAGIMKDASNTFLMNGFHEVHSVLAELQEEFNLDPEFYFALNEAQETILKKDNSFNPQWDSSDSRPALGQIVRTFTNASHFPIILSGISSSMELANEAIPRKVGTFFRFASGTDAFDDMERQRRYILRYMPPHIAQSESGKVFLERAWTYLRGRHGLTKALLQNLLERSFQSPHTLLNKFVRSLSEFIPPDGQPFVDGEEKCELSCSHRPLTFSEFRQDPGRVSIFSYALYTWLICRRGALLPDEHRDVVEHGYARFLDAYGRKASIDEPLVLLSAAAQLPSVPGFSFGASLQYILRHLEDRKRDLKSFLGFYIASALELGVKLCEIFDFGKDVPAWAKQCGEVVSVKWDDEHVDVAAFCSRDFMAGTTGFAAECTTAEQTVEWFERQSRWMCLPDYAMGPDVVLFIRLASGEVIPVLARCALKRRESSIKEKAISSVNPHDFYNIVEEMKGEVYSFARERIVGSLKRIHGLGPKIQPDEWVEEGMPVLRVIAPPAEAKTGRFYGWLSLNTNLLPEVLNENQLLQAVESSLGIKRPADDFYYFYRTGRARNCALNNY